MVNFRISRSIKAGKIYYIARSRSGTLRADTMEEIEEAIKQYNRRVDAGEIEISDPEENVVTAAPEETGKEEKKEEIKPIDPRSSDPKSKKSQTGRKISQRKSKKYPQKFSGYR